MTEPMPAMSIERFAELAQAYGGVIARWPEDHREPASALAATEAGRAVLFEARRLDLMLDAYRIDASPAALAGRIVAEAIRHREHRRRRMRWWAGLGLAGVSLAGAIAGATAATVILPGRDAGLVADTGVWSNGDDIDIDAGRDNL